MPVPALALSALVLLVSAFGLALEATMGTIPGQRVLVLVALLVLAAGLTHLFMSRRKAELSSGIDQEEALESPASLDLSCAGSYFPQYSHWRSYAATRAPCCTTGPFIRGVDYNSHAVMADRMMTVGKIEPHLIYPPGFHTMTAGVSCLSGLEPLEIFPVLGPALLLLPALALYALAKHLWGWEYGVPRAPLGATR